MRIYANSRGTWGIGMGPVAWLLFGWLYLAAWALYAVVWVLAWLILAAGRWLEAKGRENERWTS